MSRITRGKIQRDVENVERFARFVLVTDGKNVSVIDNGYLLDEKKPFMPIIAVVGREIIDCDNSEHIVLLEVGYGRARPYQQIEARKNKTRIFFVKGRRRTRFITDDEMMCVYKDLVQCMADIVVERRENWSTKDDFYIPNVGYVQRGIYFTFDKSDVLLCRHMLLEDVRYRELLYIEDNAKRTCKILSSYKRSHYSVDQLKSFKKIRMISWFIENNYSDSIYRYKLLELIRYHSWHSKMLLDEIISVFELQTCNEDIKKYLNDEVQTLPWMKILHCRRIFNQPHVHAKNGVEFELLLEDEYRKQNEVPF